MRTFMLKVCIFFFLIPLHTNTYSQSWEWQHAKPQGNALTNVFFVDSQHGWASGLFGTILHTNDGGLSWTEQERVTNNFVMDVHFANTDIGFAVTNEGEILGTTNSGIEWQVQFNNSDYGFVAVHATSSQSAIAVGSVHSYGSIVSTNDGGQSWQPVLTEWSGGFLDVTFVDSFHGWACGLDGLMKHTTDGGFTWSDQTSGVDYPIRSVSFINSDVGWATGSGSSSSTYPPALLKTEDGGNNWFIQYILPNMAPHWMSFIDELQGWMIAYKGYPYGKFVLLSTIDGGYNWIEHSEITKGTLQAGYFTDDGNDWIVGYGGLMLFSTDNGWNWSSYSEHKTYEDLNAVHFVNVEKGWAVGSDLLLTEDGGNNWALQETPYFTEAQAISFVDDQTGYILAHPGAAGHEFVLYTDDGGMEWGKREIPTTSDFFDVFFTDENNGWVVGDYGLIYHTQDAGLNWILQDSLGDGNVLNAVCFTGPQKGWAVGEIGLVLKTTDGGINWVSVSLNASGSRFHDVFFTDDNNGYIVGFKIDHGGIILRTTDGGINWEEQIIENGFLKEVYFLSPEEGYVLDVINQSVFYTDNAGESWVNMKMPSYAGRAMTYIDDQNGWVVGFDGAILKYNGGASAVEDIKTTSKIEMTIYPNPTNGLVQVVCPNHDADWIQVVSLSGQVLHNIPYKGQQIIDLRGLVPGVYIIRAIGNQGSVSKKIVLTH